MATMYVHDIPTNETVNLREQPNPNARILVRVPYGSEVDASPSDIDGWHNCTYWSNGLYGGYMMSRYLTPTNPSGGGSSGGGGSPTLGKTFLGYCNGNDINVRIGPGTSYSAPYKISNNAHYNVSTFTGVGTADQQRSWLTFQWNSNGEYVYVYARYMYLMNPDVASALNIGPRARVNTSGGVNLRELPSTSSTSIKVLSNGTKMIVLDSTSVSGWWRVVTGSGTGWVSKDYVVFE